MTSSDQLLQVLQQRGVSRRLFLKYCASTAALLGLPLSQVDQLAHALEKAQRRSVVWLSFQECTGCTESLTRAYQPSIEQLILDILSLDYHHTLQAASGRAAEAARVEALRAAKGQAILVVDGSIPLNDHGACCTIAGRSSLDLLKESVAACNTVVAVGSCAAFGGLPMAQPNPTGAQSMEQLMQSGQLPKRSLINLPGCPPVPELMAALLSHLITFKKVPELDELNRPRMFYGETVHQRCSRLHFYEQGKFAKRFDDEGARKGWCLYELGCRGPVTYNACTRIGWNNNTSDPIRSGHPCLGCSEPEFWDHDRFYTPVQLDVNVAGAQGKDIYDSHCVYCHSDDPNSLRTATEQIPAKLNRDAVRAHRFELDEASIRALQDYIRESRK